MTCAILLISTGRWQQANTQQPIGVVGLVIIHVSDLMAYGASREFCPSDNDKTTWSVCDGIVMHYAVRSADVF